jgi:LmbE family N-acetylglucosaminyl deacetylase
VFSRNRRRGIAGLVALLLVATIAGPTRQTSVGAAAQIHSTDERGALALGQAIRRLGVVASVLHTGAHPDDEDSGLLAYLARGRQARTAYLSLTRGDGGQNVIGPEINETLGVIRTEELLAARRLDGASQYFSRAFDFGFSKSRTETLSKWDRNEVLADIVRVIRTFRPLVIVSAWSGTPNDGHGHHQAAGFLTLEAYRAAADPNRFPEQRLEPWQARKLYTRSFDGAASPRDYLPTLATLSINTGEFDPLLGCSYYEIAARGRSQHRSQDQGTIEARGPRYSRLRLIDSKLGPVGNEKDIFEGIDTSIAGITARAGGTAQQKSLLAEVQSAAEEAAQKYNSLTPASVSPIIARGLSRLRQALATVDRAGSGAAMASAAANPAAELLELLKQKEADFADALARSQGAVVDCLSDDEAVAPGQSLTVTVSAYVSSASSVGGVRLTAPAGWTVVQQRQSSSTTDGRLISQTEFKVTLSADQASTRPYWLSNPRKGDMFQLPPSGSGISGVTGIEPFQPPVLLADVQFDLNGERFTLTQPAQYRYADSARGEIRRELKVVPAISVSQTPEILVIPFSKEEQQREVNVSVVNNAKGGSRGSVRLKAPPNWSVEQAQFPFDLKREGERAVFTFKLRTKAANETRAVITSTAETGGREYSDGYQTISYPHIESRFFARPASTVAEALDVKVAKGLKVGFIEGAGDDFADALRRIGVDVTTIDAKALAFGDLSEFDTIVSGVRAYEVRSDLVANNARLLDFVNRGGTYIVQYNRGNFETAGYAPYRIRSEATQPQRGRLGENEPRRLFVRDSDLPGALAPRGGQTPAVAVVGDANDKTFEAIRAAVPSARLVAATELATADLGQYDVLVVSPEAARLPELKQNNQRLLDYSRRKLVILGYSQAQYESGDFPIYPKPDARPFRTTDENAEVVVLQPTHPRFNFPNKITSRDFEGWVQERGAYFLSEWDEHFKPLLSSHDEYEPDLKGGEVIAQYGHGLYVYTAYAWFRQLPRGVPGAYRLVANLVSLPKAKYFTGAER